MNSKRIVITGAPGTGKTAVVNALIQAGYNCFPEVIREFTQEETSRKDPAELKSNPIVFADDSLAFNQKLITGRQKQFMDAPLNGAPFSFYDRGLPDVLAYMDFFKQSYPDQFVDVCNTHKYDAVFIMPPWEDIFHADGGRFETYQEALSLHESLTTRYLAFNYLPISVPKLDIAARTQFIINNTQSLR